MLNISEPKKRIAIGIDLGTTHTLVAIDDKDGARVLGDLLPSVAYYGKDGILIGQAALAKGATEPQNTLISTKRFMGRTPKDIRFSHPYTLDGDDEQMASFITDGGQISPVMVAATLLAQMKSRALDEIAKNPNAILDGAVITVPAYFDDAQRAATLDAARAANLSVLRLINEPTAAAIAYGLDADLAQKTILVYDLGGGTFDVSILKLHDGAFEVLATGGNSALGGDDIDRLIMRHLAEQMGQAINDWHAHDKSRLQHTAKSLKEQLSHTDTAQADFDLGNAIHTLTLHRDTLLSICAPIIGRTHEICTQVLKDANAVPDEIILVGGSTKMPIIADAVAKFFGKTPKCSLNPDHVVALGAAVLANNLGKKTQDLALFDVNSLSLGLETMGGLVEVIIPKNTPLPAKKTQIFTTHADNQTGIVIHVVQGERALVSDCRSLARFTLSGITPKPAGLARVEVSFCIDVNGKLSVSAQDLDNQTRAHIEVNAAYGLSDLDQDALARLGVANLDIDAQIRTHTEQKLTAERELNALNIALNTHNLLDEAQKSALITAMDRVKNALDMPFTPTTSTGGVMRSDGGSELSRAMAALKPLSDDFAHKIMSGAIIDNLNSPRES